MHEKLGSDAVGGKPKPCALINEGIGTKSAPKSTSHRRNIIELPLALARKVFLDIDEAIIQRREDVQVASGPGTVLHDLAGTRAPGNARNPVQVTACFQALNYFGERLF